MDALKRAETDPRSLIFQPANPPDCGGKHNWLFTDSLRAGQRAAAAMKLVNSARLNGHDLYAHMRDVLQRLPDQKMSAISELLPHYWLP